MRLSAVPRLPVMPIVLVLLAMLVAATPMVAGQSRAEVTLRAATEKETVEGDLKGALELYERALKEAGSNRPVAAKVLLSIAEFHRKRGNAQARATFERILREYPEQPVAREARGRLASIAGGSSDFRVEPRLVFTGDDSLLVTSISNDGQFAPARDYSANPTGLALLDLATGRHRSLPTGATSNRNLGGDGYPLLSRDKGHVAFVWRDVPRGVQLRVMPVDRPGDTRVLVNNPEFINIYPAAWSRNGERLLTVTKMKDLTWQLAWVSTVNGALTVLKSLEWRLVENSFNDPTLPRLSPDERFIVYDALAVNPSKPKPAKPELSDQHIYVIAADGSSETELVKTAGVNKEPMWTPDGTHVVFLSDRSRAMGLWSIPVLNGKAAGNAALLKADLAGSLGLGITDAGDYYYSTQRLFQTVRVENVAPVAPAQGRGDAPTTEIVGTYPAWSPDGRSLAISRGNDVVVHRLDTGSERAYRLPARAFWTFWSQDSATLLALARGSEPTETTWSLVELNTGRVQGITAALPGSNVLGFAPEQRVYVQLPAGPGAARVVAVDVATRDQREVLTWPANQFHLSKDGQTFVGVSGQRNITRAVVQMALDGSGSTFLFQGPEHHGSIKPLGWSADRQSLLFTNAAGVAGKLQILRIPRNGGAFELFREIDTGDTRSDSWGSLSPDGLRIAYTFWAGAKEIWAINVSAQIGGRR